MLRRTLVLKQIFEHVTYLLHIAQNPEECDATKVQLIVESRAHKKTNLYLHTSTSFPLIKLKNTKKRKLKYNLISQNQKILLIYFVMELFYINLKNINLLIYLF